MEDKQSSWLKSLVLRLFESGDSQEEERDTSKGAVKAAGRTKVSEGVSTQAGAPKAAPASDKMLALKNALEFEGDVQTRLRKIGSSQDLLLYVYEVVLFKFAALHEIGLLSSKSAEVVDLLHEKLEALLVSPESIPAEKQRMEMESLRKENELLKTQLGELQAKYVKSGIISERETQLEKDINYLKRRITELTTYLQVAKKKISSLSAVHEMNQGLRARNSILNSKVEHQRKLLHSLTANQPQQRELVSTIEKLDEENKRLKEQFKSQANMVDDLQKQFPADGQSREVIRSLMEENARLRTEMEQEEGDLQGLAAGREDESLVESIERLQEENARIKGMLESKQSLFDAIENGKSRGGDSAGIAEMMKLENERLKQIVSDKKEEINVLSSNPSSQILMKTLLRLKNEKNDLFRELQYKEQLCRQLDQEKKQLQGQTRDSGAINKKIKQILGELDFNKKLVASLKKTEDEYVALKKEHSQIRTQFETAVRENKDMSKKLARLTTEYELLVKEYEHLFEKL